MSNAACTRRFDICARILLAWPWPGHAPRMLPPRRPIRLACTLLRRGRCRRKVVGTPLESLRQGLALRREQRRDRK
jgi:hypothetical protein